MKKMLLGIVLLCVMVTTAWAEVYPQRFHVQGNKIVGEDGQVAMMRGYQTDEWWEDIFVRKYVPDSWNQAAYNRLRQWGGTIVRINVVPMKIRQLGMKGMMDEIDKILGYVADHHMYAVISLHTVGFIPTGNYDQTWYPQVIESSVPEAQEFWTEVSKRFNGNKTVAFYELVNEPTGTSPTSDLMADWIIWKDFCEDLIGRIRTNDTQTPIIVGGLRFCYSLEGALAMPINDANIVYAIHPYPWTGAMGPTQNGIDNWNFRWAEASNRFPLICTELGFMDEGEYTSESKWPGPGRFRDDAVSYLEGKGISWMAFTHRMGQENISFNMTLNDGVTLKEIGRFWRDNAIPFAPKGKVLVTTDGDTWTIDGGDQKTYQSGQTADVVTNATYTITTSKGSMKTVRVDTEGQVINVDIAGGGSGGGGGGGGGGCNMGIYSIFVFLPMFLLLKKKL